MDKDKEKPAPANGFAILFAFLVMVAVAPYFLGGIGEALDPFGPSFDVVYDGAKKFVGVLVGLSFPVSIGFLVVIIYCVEGLKKLRRLEEEKFDLPIEQAVMPDVGEGDPALAHRWSTVSKHIESENPNDWKQAIMEADIMLDDLLTNMGYRGESIGEKLKRVEPAHFQTLNDAWEAHKIRNQIAHEGSNFPLNQIEARRVIQQYRKVFEEFYFI